MCEANFTGLELSIEQLPRTGQLRIWGDPLVLYSTLQSNS